MRTRSLSLVLLLPWAATAATLDHGSPAVFDVVRLIGQLLTSMGAASGTSRATAVSPTFGAVAATPPAVTATDPEAEALQARLLADIARIQAKNQARQRGIFGLDDAGAEVPDPKASSPSTGAESAAKEAAAKSTKTKPWFRYMPVDPGLAGYAQTSPVGHRGGKYHLGLDLAAEEGRTIRAIGDAAVVDAGYEGGYGNWLLLEHSGGVRSFYAHMTHPARRRPVSGPAAAAGLKKGDQVLAGDGIGFVGDTGHSFGAHLHFEMWAPKAQLSQSERALLDAGAYPVDGWSSGYGLRNPERYTDFRARKTARTGLPVPARLKADAPGIPTKPL